jgi:hypothetical protein
MKKMSGRSQRLFESNETVRISVKKQRKVESMACSSRKRRCSNRERNISNENQSTSKRLSNNIINIRCNKQDKNTEPSGYGEKNASFVGLENTSTKITQSSVLELSQFISNASSMSLYFPIKPEGINSNHTLIQVSSVFIVYFLQGWFLTTAIVNIKEEKLLLHNSISRYRSRYVFVLLVSWH